MKTRLMVLLVFFGLFCVLNFSMAAERAYPTKPIDMIIGFSPGAGADLGTRLIAENSKKLLGQEMIIQNKPGGGGRAPWILVPKATPDGYTLGGGPDSALMVAPFLEKVPYKIEDFSFIIQYGVLDFGIVVSQDSPLKTFKDLVEFARANPDKLTVGTLGESSSGQLTFEILARTEGLKIKLVPFSGAAPAVTALLGGHIMVTSTGSSGYAQQVKGKMARILAVTSEERLDDCPEVPTLKELGYPSLVFQNFYVLFGPKNMEKAIVEKLRQAFMKAIESPDFVKLANTLQIFVKKPLSGNELSETMIRRYKDNGELFKRMGMGVKQ
ncbi:MAG: tripartite tricarboxylate transporter substrate binding protein [Pseudomonadota bacterium]